MVTAVCFLGWCASCRYITCLSRLMSIYLALSLVGSTVIHCIALSVGFVPVGHCGTFVVTFSL